MPDWCPNSSLQANTFDTFLDTYKNPKIMNLQQKLRNGYYKYHLSHDIYIQGHSNESKHLCISL